ncbi:MAG: hypothetical protein AVDCRST_MAG49-736 [uncultured Thermomicrobiales bacterium]|uniref:N-acetyltransferase domain-containing protein n=1 Tax=uncultured Thermomicrobiales bacterium TaxID=1645740 RepID=A0A6J4U6X6_9BACT|nr:MAG: hypothetical protein AVDCRST_MAG49-736 [uncultured Thermomicrobiales bacterium]
MTDDRHPTGPPAEPPYPADGTWRADRPALPGASLAGEDLRSDEDGSQDLPTRTGAVPAGITVGPGRVGDLRAVVRVQRHAFPRRLAYGLGTLTLLWVLPHVRFLVAREERDGRVVGCAIGDRQGDHARVINLAVDPDARRRGVGAALLAALETALPGGNVLLMVEQENVAAQALYRGAGYAQVGLARDYYGRGRHGLWMQKRRTDLPTPMLRV